MLDKVNMADKLTEIYSLRVPESLKKMAENLPADIKIKLNYELRLTMAKIIYESRFDPKLFGLVEEE